MLVSAETCFRSSVTNGLDNEIGTVDLAVHHHKNGLFPWIVENDLTQASLSHRIAQTILSKT